MVSEALKPNVQDLQQDVIELLKNISSLMGRANTALGSDSAGKKYGEFQQEISDVAINVKDLALLWTCWLAGLLLETNGRERSPIISRLNSSNGAIWNRHDFPEQTVIEIRPEQRINKIDTPILGSVSSLLDFSTQRITELKIRGYEDARRCLEPIIQTFKTVQAQRQSLDLLVNSTSQLLNDPPL